MGKHLKRLREEKSKVKLKKTLPKGLNVTDTTFKVKKIKVVDQLPEHVGIPLTNKNQTLKDCLNYLTHHNQAKQLDGVKGLLELHRNNGYRDTNELRLVILRILNTSVEDRESKVRQACIKFLLEVLTGFSVETRSPYLDVLNKQLQRGLSNINTGVQRDSLRLVDLVLTITPISDVRTLSPLIDLLLRLLTMTGSSAAPRRSVLRRLLDTCQMVFSEPVARRCHPKEVLWSDRIGPLTSTYKSLVNVPDSSTLGNEAAPLELQNLLDRLMRTSVGVWTEVSPDDHLAADTVQLLALLTRLSLLLYRFAAQQSTEMKIWFIETFKNLVWKTLLARFPYYGAAEDKKVSRQPDFNGDQHNTNDDILLLNFNLATLYLYIQPKNEMIPKIISFLPKALKKRPVSTNIIDMSEALLKIRSVQEHVVTLLATNCRKSPDKKLTEFLRRLAVDNEFSYCHKIPDFQEWVISLVRDPNESATVASMASRFVNDNLTSVLRSQMSSILTVEPMNKHLIHALYWTCPSQQLQQQANLLASPTVCSYVNAMVSHRRL